MRLRQRHLSFGCPRSIDPKMNKLIPKLQTSNFKLQIRFCLSLLICLLGFRQPSTAIAATPAPSPSSCIGQGLTGYMNTVIKGASGLPNIKLLSPAFNLTSNVTPDIFKAMEAAGANFGGLDALAGNIYTVSGTGAYDWYAKVADQYGQTWKQKFGKYGKKVIFTEFGDFATFSTSIDNRPQVIANMKQEFDKTVADGSIYALTYFNALGGNSQFSGHQLSSAEFNAITGSSPGKTGANSALVIDGTGGFTRAVNAVNGKFGWTAEIIIGPGDLGSATAVVNTAGPLGIQPILRACVGATCNFADPNVYVDFLKRLSSSISSPVWVIAGPNEPDSESWASPSCTTPSPSSCSSALSSQKYPLRPYPGDSCVKTVPEPTVLQCSNRPLALGRRDFVVKCPIIGTNSNGSPMNAARCDFTVPEEITFSGKYTVNIDRVAEATFTGFAEYDRSDYNSGFRFNKSTYLADYLGGSGSVFYDTQPLTGSDPKTPTNQDVLDKSAIWQRLTPKGVQDKRKEDLQKRTDVHDYIALYRVFGPAVAASRSTGNGTPVKVSSLTKKDAFWKYVPAFSLEDTPAYVDLNVDTTAISKVFVPHLPRIGEATEEIQRTLSPEKTAKISLPNQSH